MNTFLIALTTAAKAASVPPLMLIAMCFNETGLQNVVNVNDGGSASYGICQVKFKTAKMLSRAVKPSQLMHPQTNAHLAAMYLKYQLTRYEHPFCSVNAYNRGHTASCTANINTAYVRKVKFLMQTKPWRNR